MIRSELIAKLVETHPHLCRPVVADALDAILGEIMDGLSRGERVEVRGVWKFLQQGPGRADRSKPSERRSRAGVEQPNPAFQSFETALGAD
ncbi:HU family DNA-binding protein [Paracoccus sp. PAMC 22219]|uniref:HU family DNA-binding protein n=1 Tax=Paracoccus sp. PAMC 22219 TaxID=1569209 RepID=UPI0018CF58CE|nr:HU family DNA-binding protein [Paracoccus sp. PAMC 22219]